jgi:hypothetical protein
MNTDTEPSKLDFRRALEALRNGVPNRDAVNVMGCSQSAVEERFLKQLDSAEGELAKEKQVPGLLVSGGFGSGKSHLLEYLEHLALSRNFVCSRVVISKETPLYDPVKVCRAAIDSAVVPKMTGQAIQEIALKFQENSKSYAEFERWCGQENRLNPLFPATLLLHERLQGDPETVEKIVAFWSGERIAVSDVRSALKRVACDTMFKLKKAKLAELALQRFVFVPRLAIGGGYRGWILLLDEVELAGRYSIMQRAKSYAELARWMGALTGEQYPGLITVAAITDDFASAVLDGKNDGDSIREKLEKKATEEAKLIAARAETGMRIIRREAVPLDAPNDLLLTQSYQKLREVHAKAYDWTPPDLAQIERTIKRPMRSYVRRWINEWDLRRIYPNADISTEEQELKPNYSEDSDIETAIEPETED